MTLATAASANVKIVPHIHLLPCVSPFIKPIASPLLNAACASVISVKENAHAGGQIRKNCFQVTASNSNRSGRNRSCILREGGGITRMNGCTPAQCDSFRCGLHDGGFSSRNDDRDRIWTNFRFSAER